VKLSRSDTLAANGYFRQEHSSLRVTGVDAHQAARLQPRANAPVPVIAPTADAFEEDRQRCMAGITYF